MLTIASNLSSFTLAAGEPFVFEVQLLDSAGRGIDIDDEAMFLTFYSAADRSIVRDYTGNKAQYEGERFSDTTGEFFRFAFDGRFSEGMFRLSSVRVELAQRLRMGRKIIATGVLSVIQSAISVPSLDTGQIADFAIRATIKDAATLGGAPTLSLETRVFEGVATMPPPVPIFTSAPTITGTPTVGQSLSALTYADGAVTGGTVTARAYLLAGVSKTLSYVLQDADVGAALVKRDTAVGAGGTTTSTSTAVTVQAATVAPTPSPSLTWDATTATISEGDSGTKTVTSTLNLVRDGLTGDRVVNLAYSGTATAGSDYVAEPSSVTIAAGQSSASVVLTINGDTTVEPDETIVITATLAGYGSVAASKTITIGNDDASAPVGPPPAPVISQTSTAGSAPFAWRTVNNSAYSGGMYWHVQRATSLANLNAGTLNGEAVQMIQPQDLAADGGVVFADLTSTPTGNLALRERVGRDDGSGVIVWGDWSNVLQDVIAATFSGTLDPAHSYKDYMISADKLSVRGAEYSFVAASRSTVRLTSRTGYFEATWTDASAVTEQGSIAIAETFDPSATTDGFAPGRGVPGKFVAKNGYSNGNDGANFSGSRVDGEAVGMILYENGATKRFWIVSKEGVYPDVPTFDANQNLTSGTGYAHSFTQPYVYISPGGGEEMRANFGASAFQHAAKIPANVNKGIA